MVSRRSAALPGAYEAGTEELEDTCLSADVSRPFCVARLTNDAVRNVIYARKPLNAVN